MSTKTLFLFCVALTAGAFAACSSSTTDSGTPDAATGTDGGGTGRDSATGDASRNDDDDAAIGDAGADVVCDEAPAPPILDGGSACGTLDFGADAAAFGGVDGGSEYAGGAFAPGIYDAVYAERASANPGSWRETFVVDGAGRFTRVRQIDTGAGSGPGPISRRSGTIVANDKMATFTYDCAESNGSAVDAGADTLPFEVITDGCNATYRYGATGIRVTLRRR